MTTLISTCATKSEFKDRVRAGINITMFDPAIVRGPSMVTLREMQDRIGHKFTVTNKTRRWFAEVTIKADRKIGVK